MKITMILPRIVFHQWMRAWYCYSNGIDYAGWGETPKDAYNDWLGANFPK